MGGRGASAFSGDGGSEGDSFSDGDGDDDKLGVALHGDC